ncbi:MAG: hypothetical protein M0Z85_06725 [Gammaproteobacteria bacterium]|nr:hypothetical protein [Gammaproteobacteria bacterium]
MKLMTVTRFRQIYFDSESAPDARTVRSWIENGDIPGMVIKGRVYVDQDRWESAPFSHQQFDPEVADLIAKVL